MSLLIYALVSLPITVVAVFAYYRTLLWIGESVGLKWLRWTLLMIVYFGFVVVWFGGTVILIDVMLPRSLGDNFANAVIMSGVFMMGSAFCIHKRYKTRLDAVGILFGQRPKP